MIVTETNSFDVVLGRGKRANSRQGNTQFRQLAISRSQEYERCSSWEAKTALSLQLVSEIESQGGRFLRAVTVANPSTGDVQSAFEVVSKEIALAKAKQALRDTTTKRVNATKLRKERKKQNKEALKNKKIDQTMIPSMTQKEVNPGNTILSLEKFRHVMESTSSLDLLPTAAQTSLPQSDTLAFQLLQQREKERTVQLLLRHRQIEGQGQKPQQVTSPLVTLYNHREQQRHQQSLLLHQSSLLQDPTTSMSLATRLPNVFERRSSFHLALQRQTLLHESSVPEPCGGKSARNSSFFQQPAAPSKTNFALLQQHANDERLQLQQRKLWQEILQSSNTTAEL